MKAPKMPKNWDYNSKNNTYTMHHLKEEGRPTITLTKLQGDMFLYNSDFDSPKPPKAVHFKEAAKLFNISEKEALANIRVLSAMIPNALEEYLDHPFNPNEPHNHRLITDYTYHSLWVRCLMCKLGDRVLKEPFPEEENLMATVLLYVGTFPENEIFDGNNPHHQRLIMEEDYRDTHFASIKGFIPLVKMFLSAYNVGDLDSGTAYLDELQKKYPEDLKFYLDLKYPMKDHFTKPEDEEQK